MLYLLLLVNEEFDHDDFSDETSGIEYRSKKESGGYTLHDEHIKLGVGVEGATEVERRRREDGEWTLV